MQDSSNLTSSFQTISQELQCKLPAKARSSQTLEFLEETFQLDKAVSLAKASSTKKRNSEVIDPSSLSTFYETPIKIVLVGDVHVGKSCLIKRFVDNVYDEKISPTMGLLTSSKKIALKPTTSPNDSFIQYDQTSLNLTIWDTAGSERYRTFTNQFFRKAQGVVLVLDLTCRASFKNMEYWMEQIKSKCDENTVAALFCNKNDEPQRIISNEEVAKFCEKWNINYFEGSAKKGTNVYEVFSFIAEEIHEKYVDSLNKIASLSNFNLSTEISKKKMKFNAVSLRGKDVALMKLDSKDGTENRLRNNKCTC